MHNPVQSIGRCAQVLILLGALGITGFAQSNAVPPDVLGIRPGMSIGEAYRILKAHDSKSAIKYGQKVIPEISEKPITHAFLYSPTGNGQGPEAIVVDMTLPPSQQTVWRITRGLLFEPGKEPVVATLLAALRQKYGPELPSRVHDIYHWVFDQQGRPLTHNSAFDLSDCAQFVETPNVFGALDSMNASNTSPLIPAGVALNPTTVVANRDHCHPFIYVTATLQSLTPNSTVVRQITVAVTDMGAGIRAGNATQAAIQKYASGQHQRELQKAQQQAPPTF